MITGLMVGFATLALYSASVSGADKTLVSGVALDSTAADDGQTPSAGIIQYRPEGMFFWDGWYLVRDGKAHVFHLQVKRPGSARPNEDEGSIGHAVSEDLLHWKELPVALRRGPRGSYDCGQLFTGSTVWHNGTWYLFYTGNGPGTDPPWDESICLATTTDGITFTKYSGNPILRADGIKWDVKDIRDFMVRRDPKGDGWIGIAVMRLKDKGFFDSIRWVLFRSKDLFHWEMDQIAWEIPGGRYWNFEVVDFFPLADKWYSIALSSIWDKQHVPWSDPNGIHVATIVGQADRSEGPFLEVRDNLLLKSNDYQGFSARTIEWNNERLMFYSRNESISGKLEFGRLGWPLKLVPRPGGGLLPVYWNGCDKAFATPRSLSAVRLNSENQWAVQDLGITDTQRTFMVTAKVEMTDTDAAGLSLSLAGPVKGDPVVPPCLVVLDAEAGAVAFTYPIGRQKIQWPLRRHETHNLRIVAVREMVEVFVDDELVINCYIGELLRGGVSAAVRGGSAQFSEITYRGEVK